MKLAVIPGDGIGPEVVKQGLKVLNAVAKKYKFEVETQDVLMGGIAIDKTGVPLPDETVKICKESDAVLLGAVGGEKWDKLPGNLRPEAGLLGIRKALGVYANLRPAVVFPQLKSASMLKEEALKDGLDIMIIRELTGGAYFGEKKRVQLEDGTYKAWDTMIYSTAEIERITHMAFGIAKKRINKLTLVDKANVLESSRLWREVVTDIAKQYPEVELNYMYVDNTSMQLIRNPSQFNVILTENTFGDIISDEASMITGSLGMLPSASLGDGNVGLYEPIHGSAPDIAGQDKANPIATIMSVAMMLRYSFNMLDAADDIEKAINKVLDKGYRTGDIAIEGTKVVGCEAMGDLIVGEI